ncbi:hypothetical protein [Kribbella sindirgiensis]|uniref:Uncharacterized protein n=1 Tax=Kribbella sindirgiensis TaxID=1124744 RepID=A0A4V2M241_9ACTN|nr:hypothetical protein [Kribbella sindirgiensis]TCC21656.1 hypothetical protein E0H50_35870 [Kribbella sindirgiensis]
MTTTQDELEWLRERHAAVGDLLHRHYTAGMPMVSVRQVEAVLCGQAAPDQFRSALQVRPDQQVKA